jgi:hypothetical protein
MSEIALAKINSFAPVAQQAEVSPEEPIFVLTGSQLQDIISRAVLPLQAELQDLKDTVALQGEKLAALEATQDLQAENSLIQLQLINDLRKKDPGKMEISRAEKIEKYLEARPDHKATFETLKGHLQVNNARLNEAIKTLMSTSERSYSVQREKTGDKRKRILIMLPR